MHDILNLEVTMCIHQVIEVFDILQALIDLGFYHFLVRATIIILLLVIFIVQLRGYAEIYLWRSLERTVGFRRDYGAGRDFRGGITVTTDLQKVGV